jgi:hypothetical protein
MSQTAKNTKRGRIANSNKYFDNSSRNHTTGTVYRQTGTKGHAARMANACAWGLESLETRQLFSTISVVSFGATPNSGQNAAGAVQAALNAAKPGDVVSFPAGTYDIDSTLNIPSGITVEGASYTTTHIDFTVPAGGYGFSLNGNDTNVTIEGFDIHSNNGAILMNQGNGYSNISILGNDIQVGGQVTSSYYAGIIDTNETTNLKIDYNWFHNGPNGIRQFELYGPIASQVNHNLFTDVWDCGQIETSFVAGDVFEYEYNYGTGIVNKGAEFQNQFGTSEVGGINVSYNVFYDWNSPNPNTFGLSVPIEYSTNCIVSHNYLAATLMPGTSYAPANGYEQRFGYAIEAAGFDGVVEDNTIIGPWVSDVVSSTPGLQADNNSFYGAAPAWGYLTTEPSELPGASITGGTGSLANTYDTNINDAPPPPANTFAGPDFMTGNSSSGSSGSSGSSSGGGTSSGSTPAPPVSPPVSTPVTPPVSTPVSTSNPPSTPVTPPKSGGSSSSGSSGTTSSGGGGTASGTVPHAPTTPSTPTSPPSSSAPAPTKKKTKKSSHKPPSSGVPTPGGVTALSALELASESDGHGQPGNNEANNGTGPLEISGNTYADGVGVNANSKLTYQLSGDYNKFVAEIGVDDASSRGSQVEFEVWADGHELYNSGAMTEGQEKSVDVRITGAQQLTLVTVNLGDPNNVEADWAAAHVE